MTQAAFHSAQDAELQSAYADWAGTLRMDSLVAITLTDPCHAMAAFIGVNAAGIRCGICTKAPSDIFVELDAPLPPKPKRILVATAPFLTFTGGTTGAPKIIQRSPASWIHSFTRQSVTPNDRVAVIGSLSHSLALYAATEALFCGATPAYQSASTPIADSAASVVYATPTQLEVQCERAPPAPLVRQIYVGGGRLGSSLQDRLGKQFPNAQISAFYGAAETSFVSIADAQTPKGSVGRAFDGADVSVEDGQIHVHSPMLFDGFIGANGTLIPRPAGPVTVGELGRLDANGNLYLMGRADRQVTIADQSIHLDVVEDRILARNEIRKVAVISLPDPLRGQALYAAIQAPSTLDLPLDLPNNMRPRRVIKVDHWPLLASGKTDYTAVAALFKHTQ